MELAPIAEVQPILCKDTKNEYKSGFFVAFLLHVTIIQSLERIIKAEISAYCYLCNVKKRETYMNCKASD